MVIAIVDIILFLICLVAGANAECVGLAMIVWVVVAIVATGTLVSAENTANTKEGRERLKREIEQDNKEWNEWRYMYQDENK